MLVRSSPTNCDSSSEAGGTAYEHGHCDRAARGPRFANSPPTVVVLLLAGLVGLACGGCAAMLSPRATLPSTHEIVREPLVIHCDFALAPHHRLLEELTARRADLHRRLDIPRSDEPIHVYLFENADRFNTFVHLHHPEFPARRAFFVETDTKLMVYAQWGDRVAEDLRHEVTHGYLHAVVPNLPLWLDEGLAEYFEVPRGRRGLNVDHLRHLLALVERDQWRPELRRLENLPSDWDMSLHEYAESWAWVHFLLETYPGRRALVSSYLRDLREYGWAEPISQRLARELASPEQAVIDHVIHLGSVFRR